MGWQYRLPGKDGKLGTTKVVNINDDNPFGIILNSNGKDDVNTRRYYTFKNNRL